MILITGGAGFIGSNFVHTWLAQHDEPVLVLDALTYAGQLGNLAACAEDSRFRLLHGSINDRALLDGVLAEYQPRAVIHFAAESHVDRAIAGPDAFIHTNIVGTFTLLEATRHYWQGLALDQQAAFRFLQVSTDEVYGSLLPDAEPFAEQDPYAPNSPYSASKAAADHLVRAWHHTYGLPVLTTHCSNNYGPYQYPEKLIPLMIARALAGEDLPIYGDGQQRRDWLHVQDHCAALCCVLQRGQVGEVYHVGGGHECSNLQVVEHICHALDQIKPRLDGQSYGSQICFVTDRAGHDRRYAIDHRKLSGLGWSVQYDFAQGLAHTIDWYVANSAWRDTLTSAHGLPYGALWPVRTP